MNSWGQIQLNWYSSSIIHKPNYKDLKDLGIYWKMGLYLNWIINLRFIGLSLSQPSFENLIFNFDLKYLFNAFAYFIFRFNMFFL